MKPFFRLNIIARGIALIFVGSAASLTTHAAQWYNKDAYATPDSVQSIGSMSSPRARWVAPPPPVATAPPPPPPVAAAPEPEPAPPCYSYDMWGYCNSGGSGWAGGPPASEGGGHNAEGNGFGGGGGNCFLTTATVKAMGKADNGEDLTMARFLRDHKMNDSKGRAATELYYLVAPTIVQRKEDWKDFYAKSVQPLTAMVKAGHHGLAIQRYSLETAKLIDEHATRYDDKELVQAVYDYAFGKDSFRSSVLPYGVKYAKLKAALKARIVIREGKLDRQQAALGLVT